MYFLVSKFKWVGGGLSVMLCQTVIIIVMSRMNFPLSSQSQIFILPHATQFTHNTYNRFSIITGFFTTAPSSAPSVPTTEAPVTEMPSASPVVTPTQAPVTEAPVETTGDDDEDEDDEEEPPQDDKDENEKEP
jgi:hypothetical protein